MHVCDQSLQLWLTLCNAMDSSLPGSSVHGVLQARILEWVAMPSSRGYTHTHTHTHTHIHICLYTYTSVIRIYIYIYIDFPSGSDGKESAYNAGDLGSIPGLGRSLGKGHGNPLQYSCLVNSMERGSWWATGHGVTKSRTWLSMWHKHIYI